MADNDNRWTIKKFKKYTEDLKILVFHLKNKNVEYYPILAQFLISVPSENVSTILVNIEIKHWTKLD